MPRKNYSILAESVVEFRDEVFRKSVAPFTLTEFLPEKVSSKEDNCQPLPSIGYNLNRFWDDALKKLDGKSLNSFRTSLNFIQELIKQFDQLRKNTHPILQDLVNRGKINAAISLTPAERKNKNKNNKQIFEAFTSYIELSILLFQKLASYRAKILEIISLFIKKTTLKENDKSYQKVMKIYTELATVSYIDAYSFWSRVLEFITLIANIDFTLMDNEISRIFSQEKKSALCDDLTPFINITKLFSWTGKKSTNEEAKLREDIKFHIVDLAENLGWENNYFHRLLQSLLYINKKCIIDKDKINLLKNSIINSMEAQNKAKKEINKIKQESELKFLQQYLSISFQKIKDFFQLKNNFVEPGSSAWSTLNAEENAKQKLSLLLNKFKKITQDGNSAGAEEKLIIKKIEEHLGYLRQVVKKRNLKVDELSKDIDIKELSWDQYALKVLEDFSDAVKGKTIIDKIALDKLMLSLTALICKSAAGRTIAEDYTGDLELTAVPKNEAEYATLQAKGLKQVQASRLFILTMVKVSNDNYNLIQEFDNKLTQLDNAQKKITKDENIIQKIKNQNKVFNEDIEQFFNLFPNNFETQEYLVSCKNEMIRLRRNKAIVDNTLYLSEYLELKKAMLLYVISYYLKEFIESVMLLNSKKQFTIDVTNNLQVWREQLQLNFDITITSPKDENLVKLLNEFHQYNASIIYLYDPQISNLCATLKPMFDHYKSLTTRGLPASTYAFTTSKLGSGTTETKNETETIVKEDDNKNNTYPYRPPVPKRLPREQASKNQNKLLNIQAAEATSALQPYKH